MLIAQKKEIAHENRGRIAPCYITGWLYMTISRPVDRQWIWVVDYRSTAVSWRVDGQRTWTCAFQLERSTIYTQQYINLLIGQLYTSKVLCFSTYLLFLVLALLDPPSRWKFLFKVSVMECIFSKVLGLNLLPRTCDFFVKHALHPAHNKTAVEQKVTTKIDSLTKKQAKI